MSVTHTKGSREPSTTIDHTSKGAARVGVRWVLAKALMGLVGVGALVLNAKIVSWAAKKPR